MKFCVMPLSGLYRRIFSLPVPSANVMLATLLFRQFRCQQYERGSFRTGVTVGLQFITDV